MDNIFVERLWRSLKYEDVYLHAYASVAQARAGIGAWLHFYNKERLHQAHGYRTPRQIYEEQYRGQDRLCRTVPLPPVLEPNRETEKCSPSSPCPPASATTRIWKLKR